MNQAEEKEKVAAFVKDARLEAPVLLDPEGKVGNSYQANAIPETVVIGKDGKVTKVFVGFNPDSTPSELRSAVGEALRK